MSQETINAYIESLHLEDPVSPEEFHQAVKSAYKDRSTQIYFIWKKLKELYPEVDANRVIREGSYEFGLWQGKKIAEKYGPENIGPTEAILGRWRNWGNPRRPSRCSAEICWGIATMPSARRSPMWKLIFPRRWRTVRGSLVP